MCRSIPSAFEGLTVAELCEASVTVSDNTAANLLADVARAVLHRFGLASK